MLPPSSLSAAAYGLRDLFVQQVTELDDIDHIRIGHPADTIKDLESLDENCLNLFFFDVNYDGYPADGTSDNPFFVRLHCLITAIGHKTREPESPTSASERDVSKGENELRLIGEVMRTLHQQPILMVSDVDGNDIAQLQVVPHPMNLDNLNHIWSTQNEVSYRLSVAYEMALAPIPHRLATEISPRVGELQPVSWGAMSRESGREREGAISLYPEVEFLEVDTAAEDWAAHICHVQTIDPTSKQLNYVFRASGDLTLPQQILLAGREGASVSLFWNVWRRKSDNSIVAWKSGIADALTPTKLIENAPPSTDPFLPALIDPDNIDTRRVFQVRLPDEVREADTRSWQAMLTAVREWVHEVPEGSGINVTTQLVSNTVLFYGGTS